MVLVWIVGGATLWVVAGAAVAFLVAAVIARSSRPSDRTGPDRRRTGLPRGSGAAVLVPAQRTAPPAGLRSQPHLLCTGVGRSPSHD